MRVLWVDADENPWSESDGWKTLEDAGVELRRVSTVAEAYSLLPQKEFDLVLVRAEIDGANQFLVAVRNAIAKGSQKLILTSSEWSKEQFRVHAKTEGAAHRYARVPMPPSGFLSMVADLFKIEISAFGGFSLSDGPAALFNIQEETQPKKAKRKASATAESEDVDVLRKYLRIKEEQLEISESEREELSRENERVRKEAIQLQTRLREFEHQHDEL
ncbi:MAG: hypothetical protein ACXVBE_02235, partial [Bdellovibrionota bacterium]